MNNNNDYYNNNNNNYYYGIGLLREMLQKAYLMESQPTK